MKFKKRELSIDSDKNKIEDIEEGNLSWGTIKLYLQSLSFFWLYSIIISLVMMQFARNYFDLYLKSIAENSSFFLISNSFSLTLLILTLIFFVLAFFRSWSFAIGNLRSAKKIFEVFLSTIMKKKIKFFE